MPHESLPKLEGEKQSSEAEKRPDIEGSQFRFIPEDREKALRELVPDAETRKNLSQEVLDILITAKEEEIRKKQDKEKMAA